MNKCYICGKSDIKLYRPYGEFLREERIRCIAHFPEGAKLADDSGWWVPLIEDTDGSVWGHTSAPNNAIERFNQKQDNRLI